MIRINLLPPELASVDRTPASLFLVILADAGLGMAAILAFVYFHFIELKSAEDELDTSKRAVESLKQDEQIHTSLTQLDTKYTRRDDVILDLQATRFSWSRKLYEFSKVLDGPKDATPAQAHPVWIANWEPKLPATPAAATPRPTRGAAAAPVEIPGYEIDAKVFVAKPAKRDGEVEKGADGYFIDYLRALTGPESVFWKDFLPVEDGGLDRVGMQPETSLKFEGYEEKEFVSGEIKMRMKPRSRRVVELTPPGGKPGGK